MFVLCGKPLFARYDLKQAAETLNLKNLSSRARTLWRYAEVLPAGEPVTLGEGMTPLLAAPRLGASMGLQHLYVKDEGLNPTGSFKARGMTTAVTRAKQLGAKTSAAPTAGNAGGALGGIRCGRGSRGGDRDAFGHAGGQRDGVPGIRRQGHQDRRADFGLRQVRR